MKLQDKVKRLLAANATLRETIKAKDKELKHREAMIEKMKCCGNCDNLWQEECSLSPESKNKCLENKSYLLWELKK